MKSFYAWLIITAALILGSLFFKSTSPTLVTGALLLASVGIITAICRKHS